MTGRVDPLRVFGVPLLLAVASISGLVAGLYGDGLYDLAAWAGLALPIVAMGWAWLQRRRA